MNLSEAIIELQKPENKFMWMRPMCWRGCCQAISLSYDGRDTQIVPGPSGGRSYMTCSVSALIDEWELVSPDTVLDGG